MLQEFVTEYRTLIDTKLDELLPPETAFPPTVYRAMRYSVFAAKSQSV